MTTPERGTYRTDVILIRASEASQPAIAQLNAILPTGQSVGEPFATLAVLPVQGDALAVRDALAAAADWPPDVTTSKAIPHGAGVTESKPIPHGAGVTESKPIPHGAGVTESKPIPHGVAAFLLHVTSKPIPHDGEA